MQLPLKNRREAGRALAALLDDFRDRDDVQVLALPRGGVPVAYEIARALDVDLDVLIVRKLGVPGHDELAMGAIASGGERVMNQEIVLFHQIDREAVEAVIERETQELERRERAYRADRPLPELQGKTVIIVDDGLATGATMRAAITAVSRQKPAWLVVAVPVAASITINQLRAVVNECIALTTPEPLFAIGRWYQDFSQTSDDEVKRLLADAWSRRGAAHLAEESDHWTCWRNGPRTTLIVPWVTFETTRPGPLLFSQPHLKRPVRAAMFSSCKPLNPLPE